MKSIAYLRIFCDAQGCSHFETLNIKLESNDYAPPATPLFTSSHVSVSNLVFLELPVGWYGDWHPTPIRQWLTLMTGKCEFEVEDGKRCTRAAGDIVMLDDTEGKGHRTRVIGNEPMRITAVHL